MVKFSNILNTSVFFSYFCKKIKKMPDFNVTIQPTNNENIVKFVTNSFLTQAKSYEFINIDDAKLSPIAQQLFFFPFIKTVYISQNFIAVEKFSFDSTKVTWNDVQDEIATNITEYLNAGKSVIIEETVKVNKKTPITIYAESTPNPSVMKFVANKTLANKIYEFKNVNEAKHSPIAKSIFNFPFVKEVFISANYVSVTKQEGFEWHDFVNELREFIKNYIENGKTIFDDEILNSEKEATSSSEEKDRQYTDIEKEIISILNEYVKPAVEGDGGNIAFKSYNESTKTVKVILQGACSGCPSSTLTLKNGIETMLRELLNNNEMTVEAING